MKKVVYIDLHVLQNVPPSCLNRDDTGSPKSAIYGGVRRARVSSQSWKRAMRLAFRDHFDTAELGHRTKRVYEMISEEICRLQPDIPADDALKKAKAVLDKVSVKASKTKGKENELAALFFIGAQQAKNLAALALDEADVKQIQEALKKNNAVDVALFGRMVADDPKLNCDACAQVAHAISTHKVENEYDFFTAVDDFFADDIERQDHAGAGHMGTVEFNSATLYRYATVSVHGLYEELGGDAAALSKAIREFARAFVRSMPTGKQNTFAANTHPDAVLACVRTDRPLSFASAFETPIRGMDDKGILPNSATALEKYALGVYGDFCLTPEKSYVAGRYLGKLCEPTPLDQLIEALGEDAAALVIP